MSTHTAEGVDTHIEKSDLRKPSEKEVESMRILVVDDEPEYRLIMRSVLANEGYEVALAENGEEALEKMHEGGVDFVISDIYMPVMDGIKFHRQARTFPKFEKIPFLFVSAFDDQHTLEAVKDPHYDGFLRKARPIEEMIDWIQYLILPVDERPKVPPGGMRLKVPKPLDAKRAGSRGTTSTRYY
jgi:two-component system sensor histidine kinase/response regulator